MVVRNEELEQIANHIKVMANGRKIAVWGCGDDGLEAARFLTGSCAEPDVFIDSNPDLTGKKMLDRYPIDTPNTVIADGSYFIVVATRIYEREIVKLLNVSEERKENHDFFLIHKHFGERAVLWNYLRYGTPLLEIGPLMFPFITREAGYDVYYADIYDKEGIFKYFLGSGKTYGPIECDSPDELYDMIMPIDFVVADGYKKAVGDLKFSAIFSSHVIEHTTDIIAHLLDLGECLQENGFIVLVIPDKRYFLPDYFREVTPFRDALDVYINGVKNVARLDFDLVFSSCPVNNLKDTRLLTAERKRVSFADQAVNMQIYQRALDAYRSAQEGRPNLSHRWVFTYTAFLAFFRDGIRAGLFPYRLEYANPHAADTFEFHIVLQKDSAMLADQQRRKDEIFRVQKMIDELDEIPLSRGEYVFR